MLKMREQCHGISGILFAIFTFKLILWVILDTKRSFLTSEIIYLTILVNLGSLQKLCKYLLRISFCF